MRAKQKKNKFCQFPKFLSYWYLSHSPTGLSWCKGIFSSTESSIIDWRGGGGWGGGGGAILGQLFFYDFLFCIFLYQVATAAMNCSGSTLGFLEIVLPGNHLKISGVKMGETLQGFLWLYYLCFQELLTCWYMGFLMVVFVSFLVYALEGQRNLPDGSNRMDNLFNGLYWGVVSKLLLLLSQSTRIENLFLFA